MDKKMDTRKFFEELENKLAQAIQAQDEQALDKDFLAEDCTFRMSDDPARQVSRAAWLGAIKIYKTHGFSIHDVEVREFGNLAVVSQVLRQEADVSGLDRSGHFFIIDVWKRMDGKWKVAARYSSPAHELPQLPKSGEGFGH